jgi:hypothetical protein
MSVFFLVDDKHIPVYRIMWIAATPHFCGSPECEQEGDYEIRLEQGESVWAPAKSATRRWPRWKPGKRKSIPGLTTKQNGTSAAGGAIVF